jgi:pimeloyl-ACP methyl ester carboxylesterase
VIVASSGDVGVVVHDLGGHGRPLLFSHATGFHGRCYIPMAEALADRFHSIAFDFRGHGDTAQPEGVEVDWNRYGDDAEAVAVAIGAQHGSRLVGFGHSMGATCLLMAAHRRPDLFGALVLFEPIIRPTDGPRPTEGPSHLITGALRRRRTFPSVHAAIENYASKPPLSMFTPDALEAYVRYGFASDRHGVHLKCTPELEAATFTMGSAHDTWDRLPEIAVPTLVISGGVSDDSPSVMAAAIADRLPAGQYQAHPEMTHFGPMSHPGHLASVVGDFVTPG